jgi:hypothetical protein
MAVAVTADSLQRDYERNEVAADLRYRNKVLLITGEVSSISRSIGDNYFVSLSGGSNQFLSLRAMMADGVTDYLAGLEKGHHITLACEGGGMVMRSAVAIHCRPSETWVAAETNKYLKTITGLVDRRDPVAILMMVRALAIVAAGPDMGYCADAFSPICMAELSVTRRTKVDARSIKSVEEKTGLDAAKARAAFVATYGPIVTTVSELSLFD